MKKEKKEKTPSKFKLWKKKMKSTPKGKAYLKLIYWAIFFVILFIFLAISSAITSNYKTPTNHSTTEDNPDTTTEVNPIPQTLDTMMDEIIHGTYEYTYDIHVGEDSFLFEGTKYDTYQEGYKNYATTLGSGVIRYYIDSTGTYQVNGNERVLIDNFYEGINSSFLAFESLFSTMNTLGLVKDENNTSYAVYTCSDGTYNYILNINPDGTHITDISIVSKDGNTTYLLSFTNIGEVSND